MPRKSIPERFWSKVDTSADCWLWLANKDRRGYGQFYVDGRQRVATHVVWELVNGPIPVGMWVLHQCDNPRCVNPTHLFLGTHSDNMRDMWNKGRGVSGSKINASRGEGRWSARITAAQVIEIRARFAAGGITQDALGRDYGITGSNVSAIVRRKNWKHVA